jgi:hypothetical protein
MYRELSDLVENRDEMLRKLGTAAGT